MEFHRIIVRNSPLCGEFAEKTSAEEFIGNDYAIEAGTTPRQVTAWQLANLVRPGAAALLHP
ncbi:MAG: hypothetical protein ACXW6R_26840, partial [Candidatus Binatia bacterium]